MPIRSVGELIQGQDVATVGPEMSVRAAAQLMARRRIGAVGVVADGSLVGIFTERDVMNRIVAEGRDPATTAVGDVMTPQPKVIRPERALVEALELMVEGHFRHVPVVDRSRIVGMVSMRDVPLEYRVLLDRWRVARRPQDSRPAAELR